jgi:hypothetical protein
MSEYQYSDKLQHIAYAESAHGNANGFWITSINDNIKRNQLHNGDLATRTAVLLVGDEKKGGDVHLYPVLFYGNVLCKKLQK